MSEKRTHPFFSIGEVVFVLVILVIVSVCIWNRYDDAQPTPVRHAPTVITVPPKEDDIVTLEATWKFLWWEIKTGEKQSFRYQLPCSGADPPDHTLAVYTPVHGT